MIELTTLGEFKLRYKEKTIDNEVLRSDKLRQLLTYLILHRDVKLSFERLSEELWTDGSIKNPKGALKNLVYRLRAVLKDSLGEDDFLQTQSNGYEWNKKYSVTVDVEKWSELCRDAVASKSTEDKIWFYEEALDIYGGGFMMEDRAEQWVISLDSYYHTEYLKNMKKLFELYDRKGDYEAMEYACIKALRIDNTDEDFRCCYIHALVKRGQYDAALKAYDDTAKILREVLGVRKSEKLEAAHDELLVMTRGDMSYADMESFVDELAVDEAEDGGAYVCGYPVFREVYRLEARRIRRLGIDMYLILFTLEINREAIGIRDDKVGRYINDKVMKSLEKCIVDTLRMADVVSRINDTQYAVLLDTDTYDKAQSVAGRIVKRFKTLREGGEEVVHISVEKVTGRKLRMGE